jgi:cytochrome c5
MTKTQRYCTPALFAAAVAAAMTVPVLAQTLPDEDGRDAVREICTRCHDLSPITGSGGFSREDWDTVVKSMIAMGASITPQEAERIVNYLAKNFPPKRN